MRTPRLGAALAPADLQRPPRPVLDGELDVDQIGQVPLQQRRRLVELVGDVGHKDRSSLTGSVSWVPATTSSPWAPTRKSPTSPGAPVEAVAE